jgi:hypothetical protein
VVAVTGYDGDLVRLEIIADQGLLDLARDPAGFGKAVGCRLNDGGGRAGAVDLHDAFRQLLPLGGLVLGEQIDPDVGVGHGGERPHESTPGTKVDEAIEM